MYKNKLDSDKNILYASLSMLIGLIIINWLIPKNIYNKEYFSEPDPIWLT